MATRADEQDGCEADETTIPTTHLTLPGSPDIPATIIFAAGSFSPPTMGHVRLLHAARDTLSKEHHVAGAYISPANDAYSKRGLASAYHRIEMCRLALADTSWSAVATWEAQQPEYVATYIAVAMLVESLERWRPHIRFRIAFVCGDDLRKAITDPCRWPPANAERLGRLVQFVVKPRANVPSSLPWQVAGNVDKEGEVGERMSLPRGDVVIQPWVGDISSSAIREHIRNGWSIHMMTTPSVVSYLERHKLFHPDADDTLTRRR